MLASFFLFVNWRIKFRWKRIARFLATIQNLHLILTSVEWEQNVLEVKAILDLSVQVMSRWSVV